MAVNPSDECHDAYGVAVLLDGDTTNPQCKSQLDIPKPSEVPNSTKTQMCLDAKSNCQDHVNAYATCTLDIDIEKGKLEILKTNNETYRNSKTEDPLNQLQRALQREISSQIGGKFMQFLMNHSLVLPKFFSRDKSATERVHETCRLRKYKRTVSFNSRKVALLFSVLSIMGTMIVIYLTLRVRQMGDGHVRV